MPTLIKGRRIAAEQPLPPDAVVIRLEPHDDPAAVADRLAGAARVEISFPRFGDGRGFSLARLLRERYGYRGELRAVGDVFRDQLFYMESCGFDAFELRDGEDAQAALPWFEWGLTPISPSGSGDTGNRGQTPICNSR
jgi:uncharacterized protein (DUF934 family)